MKKYCYLFFLTIIISLILITAPKIKSGTNKNNIINNTDEISIINNNSDDTTERNIAKHSSNTTNDKNTAVLCANKVHITIQEFINNMQCACYTVKAGDTLTDISNRYSSTCTLNASIKLIKTANKINYSDLLQSGSTLKIPETLLKNGTIHKIAYGDTWSTICDKYYPIYDINYIMPLLIFINDLNSTTLPLGEQIYLPKI